MIKLYNTLTRKKENFKPINKSLVKIYSCGPTVYSFQHIGNLRAYVFTDLLKRVFLYNNYKVKHIINVTDVGHLTSDKDVGEDKVEKAAKKEGKTAKEITNFYFNNLKKDLKKLNVINPSNWPKASEHIKEQINLIKSLEKKGYTYKTKDGIYFDSSKFKNYGKLSGIKLKKQKAGKRVSMKDKKNPTDFALWKFSEKPGERQQEWKSPWGVGYPGWHIECSAMSMKYLGQHFDVHTGGQEHIQVHHQNEIAQSEGSTGKKFVNYWVHNGWLTFKGKKVSKSKGGLYTLSELESKNFSAMDFRYLNLLTNYKKPLEFSLDSLEFAKTTFFRVKEKIKEIKKSKFKGKDKTKKYSKLFLDSINNDLNMPGGLSVFMDALNDNEFDSNKKLKLLYEFDKVLGLNIKNIKVEKISKEIKDLINKREKLRKEKKFKEADEIRNKLAKKGVLLEDSKEGIKVKFT